MPRPTWFDNCLRDQSLTDLQLNQLFDHYKLLVKWNQRMNLTSVPPGPEMVERHYGESLFFGAHLPVTAVSIVDIGSGAGFPGVPLAIQEDSRRVTLVESNQKKAVFLKEAARSLINVSVLATRAEEVRRTFDWIVSRAVDPTEVLRLLPRLALRVGLMIGEGDVSDVKKRTDIAWSEPIQLPWGDRRFCVYGECST